MQGELCFELVNGSRICIPIPVLIQKPPLPGPNPFDIIQGQDPEPWLKSLIEQIIRPEPEPWLPVDVMQDIVVLASMDTLASQLSFNLKSVMQSSIRDALRQQRLPDNVRLNLIEDQTQMQQS